MKIPSCLLKLLGVAGLTFASLPIRAQAPPNDLFANAIPISGPIATVTGSNVGATKPFGGGQGEPNIAGNFGGANVWWTWTALASGATTIDTEGSSFNTLLGVYTGNAGNALTLVAANNDFNGNTWSRVEFSAVAGTTYRIQVDGLRSGPGFGSVATGSIVLNVKGVGGIELSISNGMVFTVGDPIPVAVTITPDFPNPPVTHVDFFRGTNMFASISAPPFEAVATGVPAGSNSIYVVAYDATGNPVQSPVVRVFVQSIGMTILTPFEDTVFPATNPIPVTAWAYLPSGTMTNVEFYVDGVKFAEDDAPPYSATWSNTTAGSHRLTVVGRSDSGGRFTSQPVNVGVVSEVVPWGAVWRFLDNGSDQGTAWTAPDFDDYAWNSGPAELGYGDNDEATVVEDNPTPGYTGNATDRFITTYFRRSFEVAGTNGIAALVMVLERDDGAVVHLNGRELYRSPNMPAAPEPITYTTVTSDGIGIEDTLDTVILGVTNLLVGSNTLAVEIHQQAANSSDISFNLLLWGIPTIIHNLSPSVGITNLTNGAYFLAPTEIALEAEAGDDDGSVAKVEFFASGVKVGETTNAPYGVIWSNPPIAAHLVTAVATDDQGATTISDEILVVVYDLAGTPVSAITSPVEGFTTQGPTNWLVTATANAITGVTNVQFLNNGVPYADDATAPYSANWIAPFGTNLLATVAYDANGVAGTSPVVTVFITIPPTNVIAPTVAVQFPLAGAVITNLTNITVTFSENAQGIDASDLLINGVPATSVSAGHSTSNYSFAFPHPPYGTVNISWAEDHGVTDYGWPELLPFNHNGTDARWNYSLIDQTPPVVTTRLPAAGSIVTNLTQISVNFSESVGGVDAGDLLLNGLPAQGVSGSGSSYVFSVVQPGAGTNFVTWATNHGIADLATVPNSFNRLNNVNNWSFVLDTRVTLIHSNSTWLFVKGTNEASDPRNAWRQLNFDDSGWSNAPAPFFYGETSLTNANIAGTTLSDMQSNYTSIFLRKEFTVLKRGEITNLFLNAQVDDGFIAWINGVEAARVLMPAGDVAYNAVATQQATENNNNGATYIPYTLSSAALNALVDGRNVISIQAFNQNLTNSSDFSFNAHLYYFPLDPTTVPPRILTATPPQGDVLSLSNVTIAFSEAVSGVGAGDLLVNGTAVTGVTTTTNTTYDFTFVQPPYGNVLITWHTNHGITDFDNPPKSFNGTNTNAFLRYFLINPSNPKVASQAPVAGSTITGLTAVAVTFTEPVNGVNAADLLVAGAPASAVSTADNTTFNFTFTQPPFGSVTIRWATNHGITDVEAGNAFDPTRFGGQWNYTLIDPVPAVALTSPTNNTFFLPPLNVTLRATATDNDGTVSLVEFFEGTTKLGEGTSAPYVLGVSNLGVGSYTFRAIATDNGGLIGTSAPVVVNVVTSLPISLVRGPYLQGGSTTSGIVRWRTQVPSDAVVRYGPSPDSLTGMVFTATSTNNQILQLTGLEPDTTYYYSIGNAAQTLVGGTEPGGSNYWFKTSPMPGTRRPVRFWALGDAGTAGNGAPDRQQSVRNAFYALAATNGEPDLWLMLGDNAYNSGTDTEHQAAVFDMYPNTLRNKFLWPTLGNHETAMSTTATDFPYLDIFSLPRNGEAGGMASGTEKYYSYDYANIHFICLDSMTSGQGGNTAMANWLRADLEAAVAEWIIVFFHHPPYTKGSHNSDTEGDLVQIRQNLVPILENYGVDLVLSGHSHCYERSFLMNGHYGMSGTLTDSMKVDGGDGRETGDGAYRKNESGEGTVYAVAGSSGQATFLQADAPLPAMYITLLQLGSMVIDVNGNRLDAIFLRETGLIEDRFTIIKPPLAPLPPSSLVALPTSTNTVMLSWIAGSTNHTGYAIERSTDGVNYTEIQTLPPGATSTLDTGLLANTTYYYRARATNSFGASDFSNIASARTVAPTSAPRAPTGLIASAGDGVNVFRSRMVLNWLDRSTNEAAFQIERTLDGSTFTPVATVAANVTQFVDEGLDSATLYFYRVRAVNALSNSAPSNLAGDQTHPQSQFARVGEMVALHAGAEGQSPVTYQWRFNRVPMIGQTNEMLLFSSVQLTNEGEYTVVVGDASGFTTTRPASLVVVAPPSVIAQPADQFAVAGWTVNMTVGAAGTDPLTYRWRRNGIYLPGTGNPTLTLTGVQVSDSGGYDVVVENDFGSVTSRVAVLTVYTLPVLAQVPDVQAEVLRPVTVSNVVHDSNQPPLQLTYSLAPGAPTNSRINAATGRFNWTPNRSQAPGTHPVTVRVADTTRPVLSNEMTFNVVVNDYVELTAGSPVLLAGTNSFAAIDFFSSVPLTNLDTVIELNGRRLANLSVEALSPALATVALVTPDSNTAALTFTATAGNVLQGTQQLARLRFTAPTGFVSAFLPLHVASIVPGPAEPGVSPTLLSNDGRVTVIGTQPLVDGRMANGEREVIIYGRTGTLYQVQYATNLASPIWVSRANVPLTTNMFRSFLPRNTPPTNRPAYFRVLQP